jgi:spore germination protein (amino acid permease)
MGLTKISEHQLATFIACSISSNGIMILREMFRNGQQDAWLGFFLPIVYAIIIVLAISYITKGEEERNLLQLNKKFFGMFGGSLVNCVFAIYLLFLVGMEVNKLTTTIKYYLHLPETPLSILIITLVLAMTYLANAGIEVIVRFASLVVIPYILAVFFLPFLLFNELEMSNLVPILSNGFKQIAQGSFFQLGLFGEIILYALILGDINKNRTIGNHSFVRGTVLGAFVLTIFTLMTIITVGVPIVSNGYLPPIFLVQLIHPAEFLDRFDLFLFSTWLLCYFIRIVFFYFLIGVCISFVGKENQINKDYTILLIPIVVTVSQIFFHSPIQTSNFENYTWQILSVGFQVSLLLILAITKWMRGSILK